MTTETTPEPVARDSYRAPGQSAASEKEPSMRTSAAASARRRKTRRSPAKKSAVTALRPADDLATVIASWTPKTGISRTHWSTTAPVVRDLVTRAKPGGEDMARKYLMALARHAAVRHAAGMDITDTTALLADDALAATLGKRDGHDLSESSQRTHLVYLRRMRERILPNEYGQPKELTRLAKSPTAEPYTPEDITTLMTWCRHSGHAKAARLHAAVLLSLGCGIDGYEAAHVKGTDVLRTPWGLLVRAPGMGTGGTRPARLVPVLADYEKELAQLAVACGDEPLVGESSRGINKLTSATTKTPSVTQFNAGRGRATWMRTLLIAGATFVALRQAGVSSRTDGALTALSADLSVGMEELTRMLRGGEVPFDTADDAFAGLADWSEQ